MVEDLTFFLQCKNDKLEFENFLSFLDQYSVIFHSHIHYLSLSQMSEKFQAFPWSEFCSNKIGTLYRMRVLLLLLLLFYITIQDIKNELPNS